MVQPVPRGASPIRCPHKNQAGNCPGYLPNCWQRPPVSSTNPAAWAAVPKTASSRRMSRSARSTLPKVTFLAHLPKTTPFLSDIGNWELLSVASLMYHHHSTSFLRAVWYQRHGTGVLKDRMELYHAPHARTNH